jgi:hypothetical protein
VSYVIVFRAHPDVDHMAPLAWRLLEDGDEVHAVASPGLELDGDHRLALLRRYERFTLHDTAARPWRRTLPWALWLLARHRARAVCVEWGYGLRAGWDRPWRPAWATALVRAVARSVLRRRDPRQVRVNVLVAARLLGRAAVCLPHGLSIKLSGFPIADRTFDWSDRNRFAAYVLNTEHHRQWHLTNAAGDPDVVQTWGSLRWAPEWSQLNRELAPSFTWPEKREALRVVLMVPKWGNNVDGEAVLDLVGRLSGERSISLVVKGHPRKAEGSADPLRTDPRIDWSRIHDATGAESVSLIAAADVVVDVGSSIGIEVVSQGKVLVNPAYLHDVRTLFDDVPGSCVVAHSADETLAALRALAAGHAPPVTEDARDELLRRAVYGSRAEPFDVIATYADNVRALARDPRPLTTTGAR